MNGSSKSDAETDRQCPYCGLYYSKRGIHPHRRNCQYKEWPGDTHPEAVDDVDDLEDSLLGSDPSPEMGDPSPERGIPHPDGVGGEGTDPSDDGGTPETSTRTDGGPQAPPEPDLEDVDDGRDDADPEPTEEGCPECGSSRWFAPGDLPDRVLEATDEDLAGYDRACEPCSTTENGDLAATIEVYDT